MPFQWPRFINSTAKPNPMQNPSINARRTYSTSMSMDTRTLPAFNNGTPKGKNDSDGWTCTIDVVVSLGFPTRGQRDSVLAEGRSKGATDGIVMTGRWWDANATSLDESQHEPRRLTAAVHRCGKPVRSRENRQARCQGSAYETYRTSQRAGFDHPDGDPGKPGKPARRHYTIRRPGIKMLRVKRKKK